MSSKNHVKFRKDSIASGSSRSSTSSSHRRSDSGAGSLSDHDSRTAYSDNGLTSPEYEEQQFSVSALREALGAAHESRDRWKDKAHELGADLTKTRKEMKEIEARWTALVDRNEVIEGEKKKLFVDKKALAEENNSLRDQIADLQQALEKTEKALEKAEKRNKRQQQQSQSEQAPVMSSATPTESSKVRRSPSKRDKASDAEQAQKDKARLSRRFERSDESDGNSTSTAKSHRSRRASYVEPMGPPAARPVIAQGPASPTRQYSNYTTSSQYPPQYTTIREPAVSNLPRSIHPSVSYVYDDTGSVYYAGDHYPSREAPRR